MIVIHQGRRMEVCRVLVPARNKTKSYCAERAVLSAYPIDRLTGKPLTRSSKFIGTDWIEEDANDTGC